MLAVLKKNEKGLTLIELLAVLVIIGIIAAIAIPAIGSTINNARERATLATLDIVRDAAQRYYMDELVDGATLSNVDYTTSTTTTVGAFLTTLENDGYLVPLSTEERAKIGRIQGTVNNGVMNITVTRAS